MGRGELGRGEARHVEDKRTRRRGERARAGRVDAPGGVRVGEVMQREPHDDLAAAAQLDVRHRCLRARRGAVEGR